MMLKLKPHHMLFVDKYIEFGNQVKAYQVAFPNCDAENTKTIASNASRLMREPEVRAYLDERLEEIKSDRTASMIEVAEFWTRVMRNQAEEMKHRLRASEYIARTNGAFLDSLNLTGDIGVTVKVEWE